MQQVNATLRCCGPLSGGGGCFLMQCTPPTNLHDPPQHTKNHRISWDTTVVTWCMFTISMHAVTKRCCCSLMYKWHKLSSASPCGSPQMAGSRALLVP
eukprot:2328946-Amphidinium_carterae.2